MCLGPAHHQALRSVLTSRSVGLHCQDVFLMVTSIYSSSKSDKSLGMECSSSEETVQRPLRQSQRDQRLVPENQGTRRSRFFVCPNLPIPLVEQLEMMPPCTCRDLRQAERGTPEIRRLNSKLCKTWREKRATTTRPNGYLRPNMTWHRLHVTRRRIDTYRLHKHHDFP